jgi:conjugal transfer pilus assembly protein TraB
VATAKRTPARSFVPTAAAADADAAKERVIEEMVPNERQGFLPAGSFASATLISGVEAFTGGTAQQQPQPLVIRVDANAVLPNAANYQIKGCHVLASAWGDMSSERVFGRLATLTCVDSANRLVLSEEVEGVLVDSDGKNGIRGSLQDRQGAKLARSLLAGFAQGVSSAFGAAQSTTQTTALGMTTAMVGSNATRAGAYQGASTAAQQLADFYLKQAEATMPVIAIDAGRKVSVLFTKSKALKFETTNTYRVKPQDKMMVERPGN